MSGYIGSTPVVTQVDGYNRTEADAEFVDVTGDTVTGSLTVNQDLTVDTDTLYVDSTNNRVGIGTSSPDYALDVAGTVIGEAAINLLDNRDGGGPVRIDGVRASNTPGDTAGAMRFYVSDNSNPTGTEAMRIDSSGNMGIGTSSPQSELEVTGSSGTQLTVTDTSAAAAGPIIQLNREDTSSSTNESVGKIEFRSGDASGIGDSVRAYIQAINEDEFQRVALRFATGNFSSAASEAMRIDSSGHLLVGKTSTAAGVGAELRADGLILATRDGNRPLYVNRLTNDGALVSLVQAGTEEGSISVSGTTVSYNGGHLSRWSRLPDGTDDTHIYKGTVMTNLDEMCEWRDEEGDLEDNEQLNKTTVSSTEGDPNVAGLFVAWDHDDDWGDYYLAMTGDLVVRIAQGVTVQRGDLLMSAGDGTAKPQGDDIVRSKTVAKVTSTHVSHTYPDGSYAVPCVVMAS